jgi:SAM-dependent methyltransferase
MSEAQPQCAACGEPLPDRPAISTHDRQGVAEGSFEVRVCGACGSGTTLPPVEETNLGGYYGSAYGPHASSALTLRLAEGVMLARLRTRLLTPLRNGATGAALDVGSGRGDLLKLLRRRGWAVTGLEPSSAAAEAADGEGVPTHAGTLGSVGLAERSFDAVILHHSLEHIPEPVAALRTAAGLLSEDGTVYIAVPNFGSRGARRLGERWWALDVPRHRTHFTRQGLEKALLRAGLRPTYLRETASVLGPAANLQERMRGSLAHTGPVFLVSYGLALGAYPAVWGLNELRGRGEFLSARAVRGEG